MGDKPEDFLPMTLLEFWQQQVERAARRGKSRGPKGQAKADPVGRQTATTDSDLVLIEEDRLFFRFVPATVAIAPAPPVTAGEDAAEIAQAFRDTFSGVWSMIPKPERQRLLSYWHRGPEDTTADERRSQCRWPLIQVVEVDTHSTPVASCEKLGCVLTFPASLVSAHPHLLPWEIARALAQVQRLETREHWGMIQKMLEKPLDRWEREEGARATEARLKKKAVALEGTYEKEFKARIGQIVEAWGIEEPEAAPRNAPAR